MATRIIWISATEGRRPDEARILDLLSQSDIVPVRVLPGTLDECQIQPSDAFLFNAPDPADLDARLIENVRGRLPAAPVFVRTNSAPASALPQGVTRFDSAEGPELTRSRIVAALSGRRAAGAGVHPAWRRRLVGASRATQKVAEVIRLVGPRRCTVLITGETGTGKEVVARAIHAAGPRSAGPLVALNCGAIPAALLEAELFGHTRGAFTGATQVRVGRFEQAQGGTLFLDEIGDLPLDLQSKILRVLQEREMQRLGSSETVRVDARIIAATNRDLKTLIRQGAFREDLFYRLNVVPLYIPPLRDRIADLGPLAEHFLALACAEEDVPLKRLAPQAWSVLEACDWPGNVRQLENAIASAVILSENRLVLDDSDFPDLASRRFAAGQGLGLISLPDHGIDFTRTVNAIERDLLTQALRRTGGNKKAAAEMLRLKRTTLAAKVRVLEVNENAA